MATIDAARGLGRAHEIGSIEPGKRADLVLFDLSRPPQRLIADPVVRLVGSGRGSDAHTVFVDGVARLEGGRFTCFDGVDVLVEQAQRKARSAAHAAGLDVRATPAWPKASVAPATPLVH
jgi:5-methylthioadenosine/S-adenosylhomocysteine deaminase